MHFPLNNSCSSAHNRSLVALSFVLTRSSFHISLEECTASVCFRWDCLSAFRPRFLFDGSDADASLSPPSLWSFRFLEFGAEGPPSDFLNLPWDLDFYLAAMSTTLAFLILVTLSMRAVILARIGRGSYRGWKLPPMDEMM